MTISTYKTLVFDCDGVVLDSNAVKTNAFYQAALPYGEEAAQVLVDYHTARGGISRYKKFTYFLEHIVPATSSGPSLEALLASYAEQVHAGLLHCRVAPQLQAMRESTAGCRWLIVSGGDQEELRQVFQARDLAPLFDGGIFGSPDSKDDILARECQNGNIRSPALFLGDSRYDHEAATAAGLDFAFISQWTEFQGWREYCLEKGIKSVLSPAALAGWASSCSG